MVKNSTIVGAAVLVGLLALAIQVGFAVLFVFMFIWNITDIQNVGVNGWNVTWLVLASIGSLGIISNVFRKN